MRPQRLVMQAFGPYCAAETVDFSELGLNRVFLIHGDTGAGKTTVLDAMVFALYGETSGGERRGEQMRCDSAPDDLATEVVFDFSLGERSYRVRRSPKQWLAGARKSSGLVEKQAAVVFWDRTGVGAEEEGRPLAGKVREVEALVHELLGFSCDQFRQVVVLPQGRFRELLSAGSDKREEILRQLFRTDRFREVEARLAERAKEVRKEAERLEVRRSAQLELAGAEDDAELESLLGKAEEALAAAGDEVQATTSMLQAAETELQAARRALEAHAALAEARTRLEQIEARQEAVDHARTRLSAAQRAAEVEPFVLAFGEGVTRLELALTGRDEAEAAHVAAVEREQAATEQLAKENGREQERAAALENVRELQRQAEVLVGWRQAEAEQSDARTRLEAEQATAQVAETAKDEAERRVVELAGAVDAASQAALRLGGGKDRLERAVLTEERCRRLAETRAEMEVARNECVEAESKEARLLVARDEAQGELRGLEERWRTGRAAALAATLEPGVPCPVCGATDHPAPTMVTEQDVTDETVESARSLAARAQEAYEEARAAAAAARQRSAELAAAEAAVLREAGPVGEVSLEEACAQVEACRAEVILLQEQVQAGQVQEEHALAVQARVAATEAADQAKARCAEAAQALARADERVTERGRGLRAELRMNGALEEALTKASQVAEELQAALAGAVEEQAAAKEQRISAKAALDAAVGTASTAANQEASAREAFTEALENRDFTSEDDWKQHLLDAEGRQALQQEIVAYQDELQLARGGVEEAARAVVGHESIDDLEGLQVAAEEAKAQADAALSAQAEAKSVLRRLREVQANLLALDEEAEETLAVYAVVGALADAAGGQNAGRVSFQRWVLGVYLDEVLAVAGRKLHAMSKGRYRFQRELEVQSRRRPSGLDIAVFDEFSGTARPAVTLSGGESFLAALALALGLAETVQQYAAGTPLETIFVDEGFGALDPDALELAVDTLMELQMSGRLVGVISHVPELRQVIPARLEVRGGSAGSSTRFVVP